MCIRDLHYHLSLYLIIHLVGYNIMIINGAKEQRLSFFECLILTDNNWSCEFSQFNAGCQIYTKNQYYLVVFTMYQSQATDIESNPNVSTLTESIFSSLFVINSDGCNSIFDDVQIVLAFCTFGSTYQNIYIFLKRALLTAICECSNAQIEQSKIGS